MTTQFMASTKTLKKFSFFVFLTILFLACTRISTSELGLGLLPAMDAVNTKDTTLDVETETVDNPDSLRIYGSNEHIVGNITNDPIFGTTNAKMFFQLKPDVFPFSFPGVKDSLVVDSAVLVLIMAFVKKSLLNLSSKVFWPMVNIVLALEKTGSFLNAFLM